jgi:hypothetical protein
MKKFELLDVGKTAESEAAGFWRSQCEAWSLPYVLIELENNHGCVTWSDQTLSADARSRLSGCSVAVLGGLMNIFFRYRNSKATCKISVKDCSFYGIDCRDCGQLAADLFDFLAEILVIQLNSVH